MEYTRTKAVDKILACKKRVKIIQGGSSAGKTIAILLILIDRAQNEKGKMFSVVSETLPHLKKGAMRDFLNIMEGHGYYREPQWNRTDSIYTFETGSKIEFFSADNADKVRGPRRNVLFLNEANNLSYETFTQLSIRTSEEIYIDYNPVAEFWVHDEVIPNQEHDFIILTYKDNDALPETIVKDLESRMGKRSWWKVYGEGQLGDSEDKVYPRWEQVDEIPQTARLERYGIDFGYTNDPTAIVAVYYHDGGYILDEVAYLKGMSNKQIADTLLNQEKKALVIADSAEPKSIDELRSFNLNVLPSKKGQGSVFQGIQLVQDQNIMVTKRSTNIINENRKYVFDTDLNGRLTNDPIDNFNHAMDAVRYAITSIAPVIRRAEWMKQMPVNPQRKRVNPAR